MGVLLAIYGYSVCTSLHTGGSEGMRTCTRHIMYDTIHTLETIGYIGIIGIIMITVCLLLGYSASDYGGNKVLWLLIWSSF